MVMHDTTMNENAKEEEKKSNQISIPPTLQRVLPRVIPGAISPQNKDAIDWSWQGFIAFGAQTTVVIVDPVTLQCAQTLSKHRTHVSKLKWRKTHHYHQLSAPSTLVLATADVSGTIYIWNVSKGEVVATLQDGTRPILELEWLGGQEGSEYLLAALHPSYSIILWDTRHGSKVWKKSYTENLLSFSFDPFHVNKMAFLCQGCVLFIDDFNISKSPSSNGNRFFISAPSQSPTRSSLPSTTFDDKDKGSNSLKRKVRELVAGPGEAKSRNNEDGTQITECLQLLYHQTVHDQLILLYQKEVLILDLTINQTVGVIALDRTMSPLTQVVSCWQRDVLFCLHESGSVSGHFRRHFQNSSNTKDQNLSTREDNEQLLDVVYDRKCFSEPLRLSKSNRPLGLALNPVTEMQIALVLGDGRIVFKELNVAFHSLGTDTSIFHHTTTNKGVSSGPVKVDSSSELSIRDNHFSPELFTSPRLNIPVLSLSQIIKPPYEAKDCIKDSNYADGSTLRIIMTGLMTSLASPPLVIRMCPPLTTRNLHVFTPLLAVGTQGGSVQVLNLATGVVEREFSLHTYPVRGLEWTSLTSFLSFGNQPLTNSQGRVRNELIHTDTSTGYSITLRANKTEESPIEMIRVSYLKQYFIVILKDDPFELWDCQTLTPLRTMPRRFPKVSALEWSPTTHIKSRKESLSSDSIKEDGQSNENDSKASNGDDHITTAMKVASNLSISEGEKSIIKENLVFTDGEGQLYRFSVEGNVIKDGNKNPPDTQLNTITYIARKSNDIVLGDSDGTLAILDLKSRTSKHINTHRGWVKKMRFAPGKDNMKLLVLYADGVDIWDIREVILVAELKSPKSTTKILDIDWGASDRPVLATVDGCLKVMDIHLKACSSPVNQYYTKDPIVSPYLLTSENALNLRTMMIHQPWKSKYSLSFSEDDGYDSGQINEINVWLSRIPLDVREYLENCNSVVHRALIVAYLFGDQGELRFWTVATYYLMMLSSKTTTTVAERESIEKCKDTSSDEFLKVQEEPTSDNTVSLNVPQLDSSFYHLCDNYVYKNHELERLFLHERKEVAGNLREDLGRRLAVIGERDRVVRLLLDADPSNDKFYPDCLRACLLSATHHSTQAQSTIKLVATNLIAAGNIWEGIELLCIIGKASDACRYLQSYGHWDDSIWLAKCVLPSDEAYDLVKRYAHHLISCGKKDMGVCTLMSIGAIPSALEQLVQLQHHQRAALLLDAARQLNIVTETNINSKRSESDSSNSPVSSILSGVPENIYRKYILYLFSFGNKKAVLHFCLQLGELGKELLRELEAL